MTFRTTMIKIAFSDGSDQFQNPIANFATYAVAY